MKLIAVLSNEFTTTLDWLLYTYLKNVPRDSYFTINMSRKRITTKNNTYIIVNNRQQLLGLELNDYIKAPDYESLEDTAKIRIR